MSLLDLGLGFYLPWSRVRISVSPRRQSKSLQARPPPTPSERFSPVGAVFASPAGGSRMLSGSEDSRRVSAGEEKQQDRASHGKVNKHLSSHLARARETLEGLRVRLLVLGGAGERHLGITTRPATFATLLDPGCEHYEGRRVGRHTTPRSSPSWVRDAVDMTRRQAVSEAAGERGIIDGSAPRFNLMPGTYCKQLSSRQNSGGRGTGETYEEPPRV
ncbi:hypothetical protein B2J93_2430 [Marssonina coronariae]|uniref:Uncharacterized protein n=1 Tax=Diplocarpon coronariae TaxID=2795749 RepID=A0A218Z0Y8_9HELO|nr:hypothetical protein B2J93_2430 [Marssonina coronariae]